MCRENRSSERLNKLPKDIALGESEGVFSHTQAVVPNTELVRSQVR